jgi:hypothetical protein
MRYDWPRNPPVVQIIPIDILEPRMRFYGRSTALNVAKAFGSVDCAKTRYEITSFRGHSGRVTNFSFDYPVIKELES